ncbi:ADP-ribose pyrophosphatase [Ketogulonicigenium robustum]|uniref:ADP-ribose pyrophosphatase n=1 Tax=Ketogulonicigenium robustum TaxID=92947 RepID=A0A1W6NZL6_9RHOB|nr:NUDIX hydrolase [Ketogulonicigenium robustum]ARO14698.1 ADP-ribose pyrophosphatase [Ketogulonicigenium robustum]
MERFLLAEPWADPKVARYFGQVDGNTLQADPAGAARLHEFVTAAGGTIVDGRVSGARVDAATLALALRELALGRWPADLPAMMPRVLARAAAQALAQGSQRPLSITRQPAHDFRWRDAAPLVGSFHRMAQIAVDYKRFDGSDSGPQLRDVLVVGDAALMLPYDPRLDRVLLVEQIRPGPLRRADPQPWLLEPVAGLVDAGEAPADAARRELIEEAQLSTVSLVDVGGYYPSPGASSEYFHCFIAITDLPDHHPAFGGLPEEAEDLRLHILPFVQALDAVDSGEINAGPLQLLLLQLARRREGLRRGLISGAGQS